MDPGFPWDPFGDPSKSWGKTPVGPHVGADAQKRAGPKERLLWAHSPPEGAPPQGAS